MQLTLDRPVSPDQVPEFGRRPSQTGDVVVGGVCADAFISCLPPNQDSAAVGHSPTGSVGAARLSAGPADAYSGIAVPITQRNKDEVVAAVLAQARAASCISGGG